MTSPSPAPSISSYESADSHQDRPNRWLGPAKTWQNITASDRAVAASLDLARDRDLAVHLYNAGVLKRKARELVARKEGDEGGKELEEGGVREKERNWRDEVEDTKGFVPPKSWVAWPLRSEDVPRDVGLGEEEGADKDGLEMYTYKRREDGEGSSGQILEDVLVAQTLKLAKERFRKRMGLEEEDEEGDIEDAQSTVPVDTDSLQAGDAQAAEHDRSPSRKKSKKSKKHDIPEMVPVVSTDDDRAQELLRPSIRSTLAKLDDVLMALHHVRSTCLQVAEENSDSEAENSAAENALTPTKRPQGRPRKFENAAGAPTVAEFIAGVTRTNRGRKKKDYPRLAGESDEQYAIRIARIRRVPMPALASPRGTESPAPVTPTKPRSSIADTTKAEGRAATRLSRLELRDWSDVLGMAALAGFDQRVVQRATKRCADLFGEGMTMRTIVETPFGESKDVLNTYKPEVIPNLGLEYPLDYRDLVQPDGETAEDEDHDEDGHSAELKAWTHLCNDENCVRARQPFRDERDLRRHLSRVHSIQLPANNYRRRLLEEDPITTTQQRNQIDLRNLLCLVEGCKKAGKPYKNAYSLKRHLRRAHQGTETKVEEEEEDEELGFVRDEEMIGGVHVDGFLQTFDFPLKHAELKDESRSLRARKMATRSKIIPDDEEEED